MAKPEIKSQVYQTTITAAGTLMWAAAAASVSLNRSGQERLILFIFVPLVIVASLFRNLFPLPSSLKFRGEKITFTLTDAFVLLIACWYGVAPAVFVSGVEGFISSRRATRNISSNLFSFGMMSLTAAASATTLGLLVNNGWSATGSNTGGHAYVAIATLIASVVHTTVNLGLLSTLFALRHGTGVLRNWKEDLAGGGPMFLALLTGTAVSSMYLMLQFGLSIGVVLGGPVLVAIFVWHRQHRNGVQERINLIERANAERVQSVEKAHRQTIEALAVAINAKDEVTHEHVLRVQIYAAGVARILGCGEGEIEALRAGALLHDIGKIAVPDYILNKPGKLTAVEFDRMKLHTVAGAQILSRVEFPYPVVPVVRHHHERWDGQGYPDGLAGEQIPLTARILSVVDCFDAVREDRQYRKAMTRDEAIKYIMGGSGTFYDPRVVGVFVTHLPEFEAEIHAHRNDPVPTYGIEPMEQLSEAALNVAPAAGLAEEKSGTETVVDGDNSQESDFVRGLSSRIKECVTLEDASAFITTRLVEFVPFETLSITKVDAASGENVVVNATGGNSHLLEGRVIETGEGVTGWVLANRKPFCNADPKLDVHPHLASRFAGYKTVAAFPIEQKGELLGALTVYSATLSEFPPSHQRLLQNVATQLSSFMTVRAETPAITPVVPSKLSEPQIQSELTH